jgi:hypothetical protein
MMHSHIGSAKPAKVWAVKREAAIFSPVLTMSVLCKSVKQTRIARDLKVCCAENIQHLIMSAPVTLMTSK